MRRALFLTILLVLMVPAGASAEIYKYQTKDGEVVYTTEPRNDLELIEVIGETKPKATSTANTAASSSSTGSGVRVATGKGQNGYDALIREAAAAYELPFAFVKAVVKVESNFNPAAVSSAGAMGLMQLMPATAEDMGVTDPFDPRDNVFGGTKYLRMLANRYDGDINLVLSSYNAGPGNVDKYSGIPFEETRNYVQAVYNWYQRYLEVEESASVSEAESSP